VDASMCAAHQRSKTDAENGLRLERDACMNARFASPNRRRTPSSYASIRRRINKLRIGRQEVTSDTTASRQYRWGNYGESTW
jgi:hypothetical protein